MLKITFVVIFVLFVLGSSNYVLSQYIDNDPPINTPLACLGGIGRGFECPVEIIDKTKWTVGSIIWDKPLYHEKTLSKIQAKVIVHDSDMNTHPTAKDWVAIQLWSKSSPDRIIISQLFESSENSGVFEGSIILLNQTSNPFQNKLKVDKTDIVFASYSDWTLPENHNSTKIEIITKSLVSLDSLSGKFHYPSPKKQIKEFGLDLNNVLCNDEMELLIKNNFSVCVKPETKSKLIERSWAKSFS